jgi:hypothetical protein
MVDLCIQIVYIQNVAFLKVGMGNKKEKSLIYDNCEKLNQLSSSLCGISGLFQGLGSEICFNDRELHGIGRLLEKLSDDMLLIEDDLRVNLR